jgi:hypothetical protein
MKRIFAALVLVGLPVLAQTTARQATPEDLGQNPGEESVEVPDPMVLEIGLGGDDKKKPLGDPGVTGRSYYAQKKFVCDKARVPKVTVTKRSGKKGTLQLEVAPSIATDWFRQDIDVTLAIVDEGKEVRKVVWDDLTVGKDDTWANKAGLLVSGASSTSLRKQLFDFKPGEFEALFEGEAPLLRIILDIQGDEEE